MTKHYSWTGNNHPPGWHRVGQIDVADPADTARAADRGWRIGSIYDGGSGSVAEPCTADVYEREVLAVARKAPREPMGVDQKCIDLAEHFLADLKGCRPEDIRELAESLQGTCEAFASVIEAGEDGP